MDMLSSRLFLDRRRASKFSFRVERMHMFGSIVINASCGVWWIGGKALVIGDDFFIGRGEVAEEEGHPSELGWQNFA